jgi:NAD(P)H dehydrogenase (quinone)
LPDYVLAHVLTMAKLHADNRYDRLTHDVETITGRPATSVRDFVAQHAALFEAPHPGAAGASGTVTP